MGLAVNKYATIQSAESDADDVLDSIVNGFMHVGMSNWREGMQIKHSIYNDWCKKWCHCKIASGCSLAN